MKCGFCERIKKLKGMQIAMIGVVCLGVYLANYPTLKEHKERQAAIKASEKSLNQSSPKHTSQALDSQNSQKNTESKPQISLEEYEALQKKCYFANDKTACEELKKF